MLKEVEKAVTRVGIVKECKFELGDNIERFKVDKTEERTPIVKLNEFYIKSKSSETIALSVSAAVRTQILTMFDEELYAKVYGMDKSGDENKSLIEYIEEINKSRAIVHTLNYKHFEEIGLLGLNTKKEILRTSKLGYRFKDINNEKQINKELETVYEDIYKNNELNKHKSLHKGYLDSPLIIYLVENYKTKDIRQAVNDYLNY